MIEQLNVLLAAARWEKHDNDYHAANYWLIDDAATELVDSLFSAITAANKLKQAKEQTE